MKIAFFSESIADEAALRILVAGILDEEIVETDIPNLIQRRSSSHLDTALASVIKGVHYQSNSEFLVVASDSDDLPVHIVEHDTKEDENCRLCVLRKAVENSLTKLKKVAGKDLLKVAIGVPVPAIEAWYLFGVNPHVSEAMWVRKRNGENVGYNRKLLKVEVYGTDRPSRELKKSRAIEHTTRIVENKLLESLEAAFPQGFGSLVNETRKWKS